MSDASDVKCCEWGENNGENDERQSQLMIFTTQRTHRSQQSSFSLFLPLSLFHHHHHHLSTASSVINMQRRRAGSNLTFASSHPYVHAAAVVHHSDPSSIG